MHSHQFQGDAYRLFITTMVLCKQGREMFHHSANQKYFLRQIKAMDKVLTGKAIVGAASLTGKTEDGGAYIPKEFDLNLLMLYGHMLAAGRSYIPALSTFQIHSLFRLRTKTFDIQTIMHEHIQLIPSIQ